MNAERDLSQSARLLLTYKMKIESRSLKYSKALFEIDDSLIRVCYTGHLEGLIDLLDNGYDVNYKVESGFSLLHLAVIAEKKDILCFLLSHPDIIMDVEFMGETPLMVSFLLENFEWVTLELIEAGCNVHITNANLQTPLHKAASTDYISLEVCESLIKKGVDVNARDVDGLTALHFATHNTELVHMLLYYEADPSIKCNYNTTPFMKSLKYYESALTLIDYVVDINETSYTEKNFNALLLSLWHRSPIAFEIIERGGDVNYLSSSEHYALMLSCSYEDKRLFDIIWSKMDKKIILKSSLCLLDSMVSSSFNDKDWIESFYQVFDSDIITDLVDQFVRLKSFFNFLNLLYNKDIKKEDRVKIICLFLSYSVPVKEWDIYYIYRCYGYNTELETVLLSAQITELLYKFKSYFIPAILMNYDVNYMDIVSFIIRNFYENFTSNNFLEQLLDIFKFFTPTKNVKVAFHELIVYNGSNYSRWCQRNYSNYQKVKDRFVKVFETRVPSLFELARNSTRELIIEKYKVDNYYEYHKAIKTLELPKLINEALLFKLPLYYD